MLHMYLQILEYEMRTMNVSTELPAFDSIAALIHSKAVGLNRQAPMPRYKRAQSTHNILDASQKNILQFCLCLVLVTLFRNLFRYIRQVCFKPKLLCSVDYCIRGVALDVHYQIRMPREDLECTVVFGDDLLADCRGVPNNEVVVATLFGRNADLHYGCIVMVTIS